MERDLKSSVLLESGLDLQEITSDTTTVGNIIDTQGFESLTFVVQAGVITDGDYVTLLEDGDQANLSDAAPVPTDLIIGNLPVFAPSDDQGVKSVGVVSKKRFQRLSLVSTNTTSGGFFVSPVIKGNAARRATTP